MATVIRAPQVNDNPRRLKKAVHETGELQDKAVLEEAPPEQDAGLEVEEAAEVYEPVISPEDVVELHRQVEVAEARAHKAEQALALLQEELERRRIEAREQGYAAGYEESRREVNAECRETLETIERISQGFIERLEELVSEAEDLIVETVYAAVLKIIGEQLVDRNSIAKMVRHVADQLIRAENFIVKLSPTDYELLKRSRKKLFPENRAENVRVVADTRIELGGCILESAAGSLDARLEVQLNRLKEVLLNNRTRRQSELMSGT